MMDFGSLDALVNATEKVIYDSGELAAAVTSITIPNLNGDIDEEYILYARIVNGYNGSGGVGLTFNSDTGNNYGQQYMLGENAAASAGRAAVASITASFGLALANKSFSEIKIYAKSGQVRTAVVKVAGNIATTTVGDVGLYGQSWNNTVDNITQMVLTSAGASGIGIGSRIILMKKVTATDGIRTGIMNVKGKTIGQWQSIYKTILSAPASGVTIPNLDGDIDVLYRLKVMAISNDNSVGGIWFRPNGDATGGNYGSQNISGVNNVVSADRTVGTYPMRVGLVGAINHITHSETLLYAKSGYIRTALINMSSEISGTTIGGIHLSGAVWNNTASKITSLGISADIASGLAIGTEIELERLNL